MSDIGLKLWSTNSGYFRDVEKYYGEGLFQYVELYAFPGSYDSTSTLWKNIKVPYVIHAPHFGQGVNPSHKEKLCENIKLSEDSFRFADLLNAEIIIFHPGVDGNVKYTADFFNHLNDTRIIVENKPLLGLDINNKCNGYNSDELSYIMKNSSVGFCLDFGHAIATSNALKIEPFEMIASLMVLNPKIYHLSDGTYDSLTDQHLHFGDGNYPLKKIITMIPDGSKVTLETAKLYNDSLRDFPKDVRIFNEYSK